MDDDARVVVDRAQEGVVEFATKRNGRIFISVKPVKAEAAE